MSEKTVNDRADERAGGRTGNPVSSLADSLASNPAGNPTSTALDTDTFYRKSCEANFVKVADIARNIGWTTSTEWGDIEITINLSKPEKDPRAIAAAAKQSASGQSYIDPATGRKRPCPLCVTEADVECGYAKKFTMGGEPWGLWYSPYAYYDQHCIAMSWEHRPMHVDRASLTALLDIVDTLPQYFFGSNADLPIVGGSILGHDHFQGGKHVFPMQKAPIVKPFDISGHPDIEAGIVKWPVSVIRLAGSSRDELLDVACIVLDAWREYDDPAVGIVSRSDGARHNTITPILRKDGSRYVFDLALRCNITSAEHPLGVFHPHEELHHIKKENIGLIEVMGLAILPPRVQGVMEERGLSRDDVGRLFARVLEHAGVFKWDGSGRAAFDRFLGCL